MVVITQGRSLKYYICSCAIGFAEEMGVEVSFDLSCCYGMPDREGKLTPSDRAKMGKCTLASLTFLVRCRDSEQKGVLN